MHHALKRIGDRFLARRATEEVMQALLSLQRVPASSDDDAAVERLRCGLENATQLLAVIAMAFAAVVLTLTISAVGAFGAIRDVPAWAHVSTAAFLLALNIRVRTATLLWTSTTTLASALVSQRIYGLEKQVRAARQLGPYTIEEKIGQGGMGDVYRARHALLRRATAIKLVRDASNPDTVARFEGEARLTSRLTHPNTVQVYDFGRAADGTFYYAMELIEGLTLWQLVDRDGPQHPGRVVALLRQICASLAEAHALGLIHRDVKPDNVMVCQRGFVPDMVKVVDFGLARSIEGGRPELPGTIMGTAQYMAPEAIREPSTIDARADIYSVGSLAYFLLTGSDLFTGDTPVVLSQQLHAVPQRPSSRLGIELPADLEAIVMRCLDKDPELRPQSARELASELTAPAGGVSKANR